MKNSSLKLLAMLLVAAASGAAQAQAQRGPVSYWRFEEGGGTVAADSAGTNPGVIVGDATFVPGVVGSALRFDGVDDAVRFGQTFLLNAPGDATLMLWFVRDDDAHRAIIWGRDGAGDPDLNRFHMFSGWLGGLSCTDGDYGVGIDYREEDSTLHRLPCAAGIPVGEWHHVAVTRSANLYSMYVDGALVQALQDATPNLPSYVGPWSIGERVGGSNFLGALDEIALYGRALTAGEVRARYERSLHGLAYEPTPPTFTPGAPFPATVLHALAENVDFSSCPALDPKLTAILDAQLGTVRQTITFDDLEPVVLSAGQQDDRLRAQGVVLEVLSGTAQVGGSGNSGGVCGGHLDVAHDWTPTRVRVRFVVPGTNDPRPVAKVGGFTTTEDANANCMEFFNTAGRSLGGGCVQNGDPFPVETVEFLGGAAAASGIAYVDVTSDIPYELDQLSFMPVTKSR